MQRLSSATGLSTQWWRKLFNCACVPLKKNFFLNLKPPRKNLRRGQNVQTELKSTVTENKLRGPDLLSFLHDPESGSREPR